MADQAASQPSATEETSVDDGVKCAVEPAGEAAGKNSQDDVELNEILNSEWRKMGGLANLLCVPSRNKVRMSSNGSLSNNGKQFDILLKCHILSESSFSKVPLSYARLHLNCWSQDPLLPTSSPSSLSLVLLLIIDFVLSLVSDSFSHWLTEPHGHHCLLLMFDFDFIPLPLSP